jgi:hypothetical protein
MNVKKLLIGVVPMGLVLGLVGIVLAQSPDPVPDPTAPGAQVGSVTASGEVVASAISYQGVLKEGGNPANGLRAVTFTFYTDSLCSTKVYTVTQSVTVIDGLFSTPLNVDPAIFDGQALWMEARVSGVEMGCQEILPVPYALNLRPGAVLRGGSTSDDILSVVNTEAGTAIYGYSPLIGGSYSTGVTAWVTEVSSAVAGTMVYMAGAMRLAFLATAMVVLGYMETVMPNPVAIFPVITTTSLKLGQPNLRLVMIAAGTSTTPVMCTQIRVFMAAGPTLPRCCPPWMA